MLLMLSDTCLTAPEPDRLKALPSWRCAGTEKLSLPIWQLCASPASYLVHRGQAIAPLGRCAAPARAVQGPLGSGSVQQGVCSEQCKPPFPAPCASCLPETDLHLIAVFGPAHDSFLACSLSLQMEAWPRRSLKASFSLSRPYFARESHAAWTPL